VLNVTSASGDVDAIVPFTGTRAWLDILALPVEAAFRPWFLGKQTGGYVTKCPTSPFSSSLSSTFPAPLLLLAQHQRSPAHHTQLTLPPRYNGLTFATVRNAGESQRRVTRLHLSSRDCILAHVTAS
jgi:hypothetical protein